MLHGTWSCQKQTPKHGEVSTLINVVWAEVYSGCMLRCACNAHNYTFQLVGSFTSRVSEPMVHTHVLRLQAHVCVYNSWWFTHVHCELYTICTLCRVAAVSDLRSTGVSWDCLSCWPAGQKDPGAPQRAAEGKNRTYKTKAETDKSRNVFSTIVLVLLGISVIVPMLQYWGYTSKE